MHAYVLPTINKVSLLYFTLLKTLSVLEGDQKSRRIKLRS